MEYTKVQLNINPRKNWHDLVYPEEHPLIILPPFGINSAPVFYNVLWPVLSGHSWILSRDRD
jgi:hypothetical protein